MRNIEIINTGSKSEFNRDFFSVIDTEEKAYWLGFLYADGFISASGNTVGLSISLKDIDHLKKYNNALNYTKGLNITESH
nr:MAG TPA: endonuclease [Crassvirales sp.]